jgi:hypothetical protein
MLDAKFPKQAMETQGGQRETPPDYRGQGIDVTPSTLAKFCARQFRDGGVSARVVRGHDRDPRLAPRDRAPRDGALRLSGRREQPCGARDPRSLPHRERLAHQSAGRRLERDSTGAVRVLKHGRGRPRMALRLPRHPNEKSRRLAPPALRNHRSGQAALRRVFAPRRAVNPITCCPRLRSRPGSPRSSRSCCPA